MTVGKSHRSFLSKHDNLLTISAKMVFFRKKQSTGVFYMIDTVLASAIRILWRMIKAEGADPDAIFAEAGLDTSIINKSTARYPVEKARKA